MKILAIHNYYQIRSGEDLAFDATLAVLGESGHAITRIVRDNRAIPKSAFGQARVALASIFSARIFIAAWREIGRVRPEVALVQNVFPLISPSVYLALWMRGIPVAQRIFNYRLVCPNGILFTRGEICERCRGGAYWNAVRFRCYRNSRAASFAMAAATGFARMIGVWRWGVRVFLTPDLFLGGKIDAAIESSKKVRVLFNPAPEHLLAEARTTVRADAIRSRNSAVLFVGRLVPEKGIETVLECAKRMPNTPFRIVGAGDFEAEAKAMAERLGLRNIAWLGPVYGDELKRHYLECGALVLPSRWYDNMPLVLTQALILGIPIVASRINGIPEFVIDGETGRLAEPTDAAGFVSALNAVFSERSVTEQLSLQGMRRAREWFAPGRFAKELEMILMEAKRR